MQTYQALVQSRMYHKSTFRTKSGTISCKMYRNYCNYKRNRTSIISINVTLLIEHMTQGFCKKCEILTCVVVVMCKFNFRSLR